MPLFWLSMAFCSCWLSVHAGTPSGEKSVLRLFYQQEQLVTSPSRTEEAARTAPANVEVFTAEDIRNMGARKLSDLLRTLESVYVTTQTNSRESVWFRGIRNRYNDKILLLVDGVPRRDLVYENAPIDEYLPLTNVKRIEIIRGPGSALYGSNAYAGVISIITKKPPEKAWGRFDIGGGDYDTKESALQGGAKWGNFGFYAYAHYYDTNGDGLDFNTQHLKQVLRQNPKDQCSGGATLAWGDFTLHAERIHYVHTFYTDWDVPVWRWKDEGYFADNTFLSGRYDHSFANKASVKASLYYEGYHLRNFWRDFIPGRQGPDSTPADVHYAINATKNGRRLGGGFQATLPMGDSNCVIVGASVEREALATVHDLWHNVQTGQTTKPYYIEPVTLNTWALYLQDTWKPATWATLTAGVRGDNHALFGWQTSPRLGLSFHPGEKLVVKFLYGEAFRFPSARELFTVDLSGYFPKGNPYLKPESIRTIESDLLYTFSPNIQAHLGIYREHTYDAIYSENNAPYSNHAGVVIKGLETGARLAFKNHINGYVNYSYTQSDLYNVPGFLAHAGFNVPWRGRLNFNINAAYVSSRPRNPSDMYKYDPTRPPYHRPDVGGYLLVNTTLRLFKLWRNLELSASVYNLFNKNCSDPTYEPTKYYDLKNPNRTFIVKIAYRF